MVLAVVIKEFGKYIFSLLFCAINSISQ